MAVLEKSPRRAKVVGVLREEERKLLLLPIDPRMPRGVVRREDLPGQLKAMLQVRMSSLCHSLLRGPVACSPAVAYPGNLFDTKACHCRLEVAEMRRRVRCWSLL